MFTIHDIARIVEALKAVRKDAQGFDAHDGIDVRLQWDGKQTWSLHTGDASYDQDHTGFWGSDAVLPDTTDEELWEMAERLCEECEDKATA